MTGSTFKETVVLSGRLSAANRLNHLHLGLSYSNLLNYDRHSVGVRCQLSPVSADS